MLALLLAAPASASWVQFASPDTALGATAQLIESNRAVAPLRRNSRLVPRLTRARACKVTASGTPAGPPSRMPADPPEPLPRPPSPNVILLAVVAVVVTQSLLGEEGRLAVLGGVEAALGPAASEALATIAAAFNGPLLQRVGTVDAAGTEFGSEPRATGGALLIFSLYAFRALGEFIARRGR